MAMCTRSDVLGPEFELQKRDRFAENFFDLQRPQQSTLNTREQGRYR